MTAMNPQILQALLQSSAQNREIAGQNMAQGNAATMQSAQARAAQGIKAAMFVQKLKQAQAEQAQQAQLAQQKMLQQAMESQARQRFAAEQAEKDRAYKTGESEKRREHQRSEGKLGRQADVDIANIRAEATKRQTETEIPEADKVAYESFVGSVNGLIQQYIQYRDTGNQAGMDQISPLIQNALSVATAAMQSDMSKNLAGTYVNSLLGGSGLPKPPVDEPAKKPSMLGAVGRAIGRSTVGESAAAMEEVIERALGNQGAMIPHPGGLDDYPPLGTSQFNMPGVPMPMLLPRPPRYDAFYESLTEDEPNDPSALLPLPKAPQKR